MRTPATPADFAPATVKNILNRSYWAILSAEKSHLSDEENARRMGALYARIRNNYRFQVEPCAGRYGNIENSVLICGIRESVALGLAAHFDQESILTADGLVYVEDGHLLPATGIEVFKEEPEDNFTMVLRTGAIFSVKFD